MTQAKGWVTRKREQFELFAKSEQKEIHEKEIQVSPGGQKQEIQVSRGIQEPPRSLSICHKPTADTQMAEEVVSQGGRSNNPDREEESQGEPGGQTRNIRNEAIKQSAKPSGSELRQNAANADNKKEEIKTPEVDTKNNNVIKQLGTGFKQAPSQHQATKKMVYTQYREMLKRYEQSSRL